HCHSGGRGPGNPHRCAGDRARRGTRRRAAQRLMRAPRTLVDALEEAARDDTGFWFVDGVSETFRSYAALLKESRRIAAALLAAGLRRGDLVALILPDPDQFLTALFGASIAGLVPASLY